MHFLFNKEIGVTRGDSRFYAPSTVALLPLGGATLKPWAILFRPFGARGEFLPADECVPDHTGPFPPEADRRANV